MYYLYIGIVFFIDMAMDIVVLRLLVLILKVRTSAFRIILIGALEALWNCILAVYPVFSPGLQLVLTLFLTEGPMAKVAFHTKGVRELIKGMLELYLVSVALGGAMTAPYQHTGVGYYVEQLIRGEPTEGMPLVISVLLTAPVVLALKYLWTTVLEVRGRKSNLYEMTCIQEEKRLTAVGLLNTRNRLYEPVSRECVHVVSERIWQELHGGEDPLLFIPFHTVGTEEGLIPGMILDSMIIREEREERITVKLVIVVSPHPVCQDGSYEILLHEEQGQKEELQVVIRVSVPSRFQFKSVPSFKTMLLQKQEEIRHVGGADILPVPLYSGDEAKMIELLGTEGRGEAKSTLIGHNLRLVVYTAKKFDNTSVGMEDLISIGTISPIKAIDTFSPERNIKLATYASRCVENEILIYLRRNSKVKMEVSIDKLLNVDWNGSGLLLLDILGTGEDIIYRNLEHEMERSLLNFIIDRPNPRGKRIVELWFGLTNADGGEMTQEKVADLPGISQSYISRLEKKIMKRLKEEVVRSE